MIKFRKVFFLACSLAYLVFLLGFFFGGRRLDLKRCQALQNMPVPPIFLFSLNLFQIPVTSDETV